MAREWTNVLCKDCFRYCADNSRKARFCTYFIHAAYRYTCLLRKAQHHRSAGHILRTKWYRLRLLRSSIRYGYQINPGAQIGAGLYIGHRGTVVVNGEAVLGEDCNLSPGVVIGQENRGKRAGVPQIGNHVWIGSNAVIVRNIQIGDDVLIAPGTYVNRDVPPLSIVLGNPAQIMKRENATAGYIQNPISERAAE